MSEINAIESVSVKNVIAYVGDDPTLAASALEKEKARGKAARSSLVAHLERVVEGRTVPQHRAAVDGGANALQIPTGVTVTAVTDGSTGRVLDASEYDQAKDGELSRHGDAEWPRGRGRWFVDYEG